MTTIKSTITTLQDRINGKLAAALNHLPDSTLKSAMQYSLLNGGKRVRPLFVYLIGVALEQPLSKFDSAAVAIELMHTFSLIHDDLPAMDDDDLRRGKPTCHKAYDEAIAILAGDALQTLSFEQLTQPSDIVSPQQQCKMVHALAKAAGGAGMGYGQLLDIENHGNLNLQQLNTLHRAKTGKLISACFKMALIAASCDDKTITDTLINIGDLIGLAFQIQDDLLDKHGSAETTGKSVHSDAKTDKTTYPTLLGIEESNNTANQLFAEALDQLSKLPLKTEPLKAFINYLIARNY